MQTVAPIWIGPLSTFSLSTYWIYNELYLLFKVAVNLPLTRAALCWQGPAAAGRNAAGTQQEESGRQPGNHPATDEPNSPHQSVSRSTARDTEQIKKKKEKLPRNSEREESNVN